MESVHGQDDRKRERHAMDGVWLPADGEPPVTRSLPGSRHKPEPGIAKGEAFSPLPPRQRQVGKSTKLTKAETNQSESGFEIREREWNIVPRW